MSTKRERDLVWRSDRSHAVGRNPLLPNPVGGSGYYDAIIRGRQMTVSEGHPWPPKGPQDSFRDIGGDFYTIKRVYNDPRAAKPEARPTHRLRGFNGATEWNYSGPIYPVDPVATSAYDPYPKDVYSSDSSELDALGTTAIARCKPTNSVADLSVALAEVYREGIPNAIGYSFWRDRTHAARSAGDEYLNVQFGWLPLIGAIKDTATAISTHDDVWQQYVRDAGRIVRRTYEFPHEKIQEDPVVVSSLANPVIKGPSIMNYFLTTKGVLTRQREITIKRWFSGAFTYTLPTGDTRAERIALAAAEARKVYGLTLDPEVIWNLAPWSWAADWVTNTGDLLSNLSDYATDGLVMKYGYIMENVLIHDTYTLDGVVWNSYNKSIPTKFTNSFTTEVKQRRRATPFGFGLSWDGFTTRQWAILAALGLSRS